MNIYLRYRSHFQVSSEVSEVLLLTLTPNVALFFKKKIVTYIEQSNSTD